jgi:hypothetical protein
MARLSSEDFLELLKNRYFGIVVVEMVAQRINGLSATVTIITFNDYLPMVILALAAHGNNFACDCCWGTSRVKQHCFNYGFRFERDRLWINQCSH